MREKGKRVGMGEEKKRRGGGKRKGWRREGGEGGCVVMGWGFLEEEFDKRCIGGGYVEFDGL